MSPTRLPVKSTPSFGHVAGEVHLAGEILVSRDVGHVRCGETSHRGHEVARGHDVVVVGADLPGVRRAVEGRRRDASGELDVATQIEPIGDVVRGTARSRAAPGSDRTIPIPARAPGRTSSSSSSSRSRSGHPGSDSRTRYRRHRRPLRTRARSCRARRGTCTPRRGRRIRHRSRLRRSRTGRPQLFPPVRQALPTLLPDNPAWRRQTTQYCRTAHRTGFLSRWRRSPTGR